LGDREGMHPVKNLATVIPEGSLKDWKTRPTWSDVWKHTLAKQ